MLSPLMYGSQAQGPSGVASFLPQHSSSQRSIVGLLPPEVPASDGRLGAPHHVTPSVHLPLKADDPLVCAALPLLAFSGFLYLEQDRLRTQGISTAGAQTAVAAAPCGTPTEAAA